MRGRKLWLAERGWVRIDPTAIAAPQRIDAGVNAALAGIPGLPAFLTPRWGTSWRYTLQARWTGPTSAGMNSCSATGRNCSSAF